MDISKIKIEHWLNVYCYQETWNNDYIRGWPAQYSYRNTIHISSLIIEYPNAIPSFFFAAIQIR
jgi:hypothetical protein